ncbi:hypothetical protein SAMN04488074_10446 [Lentzea albidocapillata subsp. violacea]|uniref:Uncharacterized protein n=1 Tax=Lentzea albidocapillata subsp. violacea TaxID=128104 RepID=A0A1G8YGI3_9PSEU|nr:hypothetical protein [Lentzea albidocapillata]SDK02039.1 hypothetical protein SAMN04488074_10446 [Lentzea albidocapillata subsp. violacea]
MVIKGSFTQLGDMTQQILDTAAKVAGEMETWQREAGIAEANWLDTAGGQFGEVNAAWKQVSTAHNAMLQALGGGVGRTNDEFQTMVASSRGRIGSITI